MKHSKENYKSVFIRFLKENHILKQYMVKLNGQHDRENINIKTLTQHYRFLLKKINNDDYNIYYGHETFIMEFLLNVPYYFATWREQPLIFDNNWIVEEKLWRVLSNKYSTFIVVTKLLRKQLE